MIIDEMMDSELEAGFQFLQLTHDSLQTELPDFSLFLFVFTVVFLSVDFFMPHLRTWKSSKLLLQSKVYLDESIEQGSGLLEDGVRKAKFAFCLIRKRRNLLRTTTFCSFEQTLR